MKEKGANEREEKENRKLILRFLGIFVVDDIMIVGNRREQYSMDQKCNVKVKVENDEEIRKKREVSRDSLYQNLLKNF
ncbi:hypothetical protein ANTQUA_LOCUS4272 [Anthophora quadrimaculata]